MEMLVGKVTHYFPKIGVAAVRLEDDLNFGDSVLVRGVQTNFNQTVQSMQLEHQNIASAIKGQEIGMKVDQRVQEGDRVYKIA